MLLRSIWESTPSCMKHKQLERHSVSISCRARESINYSVALDQRDLLLSWSATPNPSSQQLIVQFRLPCLYYLNTEQAEHAIKPGTLQFAGKCTSKFAIHALSKLEKQETLSDYPWNACMMSAHAATRLHMSSSPNFTSNITRI